MFWTIENILYRVTATLLQGLEFFRLIGYLVRYSEVWLVI